MSIFEALDYRSYIRARMEDNQSERRGFYQRIATHLSAAPSLVSQVMNGQREFTLDMAVQLIDFSGLNEAEGEHFLLLVQKEKAGSHAVKEYFDHKIRKSIEKASDLGHRTKAHKVLSPPQRAVFYSDWYYSVIRLLTSLDHINSAQDIANSLRLPIELVHRVLAFLIQNDLVRQSSTELQLGPLRTHIPQDSEFVSRHHKNWRSHFLDRSHVRTKNEFMFTGPTTLSEADAQKVAEMLRSLISELAKIHDDSKPETFYCLNIDWLKVTS